MLKTESNKKFRNKKDNIKEKGRKNLERERENFCFT